VPQEGKQDMSYRLYNRDGSGGFAVEATLALAGIPFELIKVDSVPNTPLPESFREINPMGQVPVLITPDGTLMTETAAILIYLASAHPETKIGPAPATPAHAGFLRWNVFLSVNVYEAILRKGYPDRYTNDREGTAAVAAAADTRLRQSLEVIEQAVEPGRYLLGETLYSVDIYLAMLNAWQGVDQGLPILDDLTHRVAGHPVISPIWQRNFDHRLRTKWGRRAGGNRRGH
jgi:glutathione S-transferase